MKLWLRMFLLSLGSPRRPRLGVTEVARTPMRVMPADLDLLRHVNNGVYLTMMDLGRVDLMRRSGIWDTLTRKGWYPVVVAETVTFRRSLELWQRFELQTRLVGVDEQAVYLEQRFVRDGELVARGWVRGRFLRRSGGTVPAAELAEAFGFDAASRALPEWMLRWAAETALPSNRESAPSDWD